MFRELVRKNKAIPMQDCIDILKSETRGILSVMGDNDYPYGTPMNHWWDDEDQCLYFHCGKVGHRLDSLRKHDKVSFCTYDRGYREEGEWAFNVKSVIVFGRIEIIDDLELIAEKTTALCCKFTDDQEYIRTEIQKHGKGTLLLKLVPEHMSGKLVNES